MKRLVVVSNRVPAAKSGTGAGGLAVGVMSALKTSGGIWFGWNGRTEESNKPTEITRKGAITFATLGLTKQQYDQYYKGYSNATLWPLFHSRLSFVHYDRQEEQGYREVNELFADRLLPLLEPDDILWIHDYHLIPLASILRSRGVTQPIGYFLHIPFPPYDILRALPNHIDLLKQLCDFDLLGFQTSNDVHSFQESIERALHGEVLNNSLIRANGRELRIGAFPIGIDAREVAATAAKMRTSPEVLRLQESLSGRAMILGVDRLDYTKGIEERFQAYETYLRRHLTDSKPGVTYLQIAPPSRDDVIDYQELTRTLELSVGHINGQFAKYDWVPLRFLHRAFNRKLILGFCSVARVGLVTPLRDGMNLVAKEFIAAQPPEDPGVLILSRLAGAAEQLEEALLVNPYDTDGIADALDQAIRMSLSERKERWYSLMSKIKRHDIDDWRERFLAELDSAPQQPQPVTNGVEALAAHERLY